jgi:hypothetical protein
MTETGSDDGKRQVATVVTERVSKTLEVACSAISTLVLRNAILFAIMLMWNSVGASRTLPALLIFHEGAREFLLRILAS